MSSVDVHTVYTKIYKFISLYTSVPQVMLLKVVLQIVNSIVSRMLMRYVARYCPAPFIRNMLFTTETLSSPDSRNSLLPIVVVPCNARTQLENPSGSCVTIVTYGTTSYAKVCPRRHRPHGIVQIVAWPLTKSHIDDNRCYLVLA